MGQLSFEAGFHAFSFPLRKLTKIYMLHFVVVVSVYRKEGEQFYVIKIHFFSFFLQVGDIFATVADGVV